jgi:hypothetical protein
MLEWALFASHPLAERRDPAQFGTHPGRRHHGLCVAPGADRAAEYDIRGLQQRYAAVGRVGRAGHRCRLPGEGRHVDLDRAGDQPRVRADAFTLLDPQHIPGHQQPCLDLLVFTVAQHPGVLGEESGERLHGAFGLHLLGEREAGVQHDHGHDRDPQRWCSAGPR